MKKIKSKNLKAFFILLGISILLAFVLSFIIKADENLIFRLSNNLFVVATFFLSIGILFQIFNFVLKSRIKRTSKRMGKKKAKEINFKEKKRLEIWKYKQSIYSSLWKIFIIVGVTDIGMSFIITAFL